MKSDYDRRKISDYHLKNDYQTNNQKAIKKYLIIIIIINQTDESNHIYESSYGKHKSTNKYCTHSFYLLVLFEPNEKIYEA